MVDDAIETAHRRAVRLGHDAYVDPVTGFAVFTAVFLAGRGACCSSGCRHCPYDDTGRSEGGAR